MSQRELLCSAKKTNATLERRTDEVLTEIFGAEGNSLGEKLDYIVKHDVNDKQSKDQLALARKELRAVKANFDREMLRLAHEGKVDISKELREELRNIRRIADIRTRAHLRLLAKQKYWSKRLLELKTMEKFTWLLSVSSAKAIVGKLGGDDITCQVCIFDHFL